MVTGLHGNSGWWGKWVFNVVKKENGGKEMGKLGMLRSGGGHKWQWACTWCRRVRHGRYNHMWGCGLEEMKREENNDGLWRICSRPPSLLLTDTSWEFHDTILHWRNRSILYNIKGQWDPGRCHPHRLGLNNSMWTTCSRYPYGRDQHKDMQHESQKGHSQLVKG